MGKAGSCLLCCSLYGSCLVILGWYQLQSLWGIPGALVTILSRSIQGFLCLEFPLLTSLLSWHLLVSVNMDFPHLFFSSAGCTPPWKKHGRKCYFFSPEERWKDWNASREECAAMGSDLVIIDSRKELVRSNSLGQLLRGLELPGQGLSSDTCACSCRVSLGSGTCCQPGTSQSWQWDQSPAQRGASWGLESCPWKLLCPGLFPWEGANSLFCCLGFYRD